MSALRRPIVALLWFALLVSLLGGAAGAASSGLTGQITVTDSTHYTSDTTARLFTASTTCTVSITLRGADQATATVSYTAQNVLDQRTPGTEDKTTTAVQGSGSTTYDLAALVGIRQDGTYQIRLRGSSPVITANVTETRESTGQPTATSTSTRPVRCAIGNDGVLASRLGHTSTLSGSQTSYGTFGDTSFEYGSSTVTWSIKDPDYHPNPNAPLPPEPSGPLPGIHLSGTVSATDQASYDNTSSAETSTARTNCSVTITLNKDGSATAIVQYTAHQVFARSTAGTEDKRTIDVQGSGTFYYEAGSDARIASNGTYLISVGSPVLTAIVTETRESTGQPATTTTSTQPVRCAIGNDSVLSGKVDRNSNTLKGQLDEHGHFGDTGQESGTSEVRWTIVDVYIVIKSGNGKPGGLPSVTPSAVTATVTATPAARGATQGSSPSPTPTATVTTILSCARVTGSNPPGLASVAHADARSVGVGPHPARRTAFMPAGRGIPAVGDTTLLGSDTTKSSRLQMLMSGKPITGKRVTVVIGQAIHLSVSCNGTAPTSKAVWTIGGATAKLDTTSALAHYYVLNTGTASHTAVEYVSKKASQSISFYFVRRRATGFDVSVKVPGYPTLTKTFLVSSPTVVGTPPYAKTCQVDLGGFGLGPGYNNSCPGDPSQPLGTGHPGIEWAFPVHAGQNQAGTLAMIQLISIQVTHAGQGCNPAIVNAADVSAFYDSTNNFITIAGFRFPNPLLEGGAKSKRLRAFIKLGNNTTATWRDRDTPHLGLLKRKPGRWYESFFAKDYLMYKPSAQGGDSIWVPLAEMSWTWSGSVTVNSGTLQLDQPTISTTTLVTTVAPPSFTAGADAASYDNC